MFAKTLIAKAPVLHCRDTICADNEWAGIIWVLKIGLFRHVLSIMAGIYMLIVENWLPHCWLTSCASSSKREFIFKLFNYWRGGLYFLSAGTTAKETLKAFFFLTEKSLNLKNQSVWEKSHIYQHMTETYATDGGIVKRTHYHMSHQAWSLNPAFNLVGKK